jgi:hypothetical protein
MFSAINQQMLSKLNDFLDGYSANYYASRQNPKSKKQRFAPPFTFWVLLK